MVESSESTETHSRWVRREWRWRMIQQAKQYHIWCFYSPFVSWALLIGCCKSDPHCKNDPRSHCVLTLVHLLNILSRPLQIFIKLEQCASSWWSRQILSRRQHAPNKQCVLNNDVHLITPFYGTCYGGHGWQRLLLPALYHRSPATCACTPWVTSSVFIRSPNAHLATAAG